MSNIAMTANPPIFSAAINPKSDVETAPAQEKLLHALNNGSSVWRTVDGLSQETDLSSDEVLAGLAAMPPETLAVADSKRGKLYTTREHYFKNQSFLGRFLTYATGQFK